jgi:hypothetical protein
MNRIKKVIEGIISRDSIRPAWLKLSEQSLLETWDNEGDEFNELLK